MPETGKTKAKRLLEKEVEAIMAKHHFRHIVSIADGARDLWRYFRRKYPDAIHVVDFFHVCEYLSKLSALLSKNPSGVKSHFYRSSASRTLFQPVGLLWKLAEEVIRIGKADFQSCLFDTGKMG